MKVAVWGAIAGLALVLLPLTISANDSDASVSLGGVVLTREPKISMESERLTISLSKVTVEYEFLNESDKDITTEVAFPIPPYEFTEAAGGIRAFDDFRLWVDGKQLPYEVEAKAFLPSPENQREMTGAAKDVTAILQRYGIDVPTLGHYFVNGKYSTSQGDVVPDFEKLSPETRKTVSGLGLVDVEGDGSVPLWEVRKTYHWRQTFPPHKVLRVRHEYSPGFGFEGMQVGVFDEASLAGLIAEDKRSGDGSISQEGSQLLRDSCVEPSLRKTVLKDGSAAWKANPDSGGYVQTEWVDYILTTANSWKTPIKKFELIVERGPKRDMGWYEDDWDYASFCWDGPVTKADAHRYEASAMNFVPKRELKVLFLTMPVPEAAGSGLGSGVASRHTRRRWFWVALCLVALVLAGAWWLRRRRGSLSS